MDLNNKALTATPALTAVTRETTSIMLGSGESLLVEVSGDKAALTVSVPPDVRCPGSFTLTRTQKAAALLPLFSDDYGLVRAHYFEGAFNDNQSPACAKVIKGLVLDEDISKPVSLIYEEYPEHGEFLLVCPKAPEGTWGLTCATFGVEEIKAIGGMDDTEAS